MQGGFEFCFTWLECHHKLRLSSSRAYLVLLGPSVTVTLLHKSAQIISCAIQMAVGDQLICFAIYGSNFTTARRQLWDDIRATQQAYKHTLDPTWEL